VFGKALRYPADRALNEKTKDEPVGARQVIVLKIVR